MAEPWDIPPWPAQGDLDPDHIYKAKGRAISAWENVEVALSGLFAIFCGEHWDNDEAFRKYGEPLNFKTRADALERAARQFFIKKCDQELEGRFENLVINIKNFQVRRNEITHSVLARKPFVYITSPNQDTGLFEYFLVPPTYTFRKFDNNFMPEFAYVSQQIECFADKFRSLMISTDLFSATLQIDQSTT